jgi:hypothetical protein
MPAYGTSRPEVAIHQVVAARRGCDSEDFGLKMIQLGHERSIFTAMHAAEACVRATNVELVGCMPSIAARARRNVVEPISLHRFVSPEIYRSFH